jgi:hypothetical protein
MVDDGTLPKYLARFKGGDPSSPPGDEAFPMISKFIFFITNDEDVLGGLTFSIDVGACFNLGIRDRVQQLPTILFLIATSNWRSGRKREDGPSGSAPRYRVWLWSCPLAATTLTRTTRSSCSSSRMGGILTFISDWELVFCSPSKSKSIFSEISQCCFMYLFCPGDRRLGIFWTVTLDS